MNGSTPKPAEIISRRPAVDFQRTNVPPTAPLWVTPDDRVRLRVWNSVAGLTTGYTLRVLTPQNEIVVATQLLTPTTDRIESDVFGALPEGWLIGAGSGIAVGTVRRGQCFVLLELNRGGLVGSDQFTLISNYITSNGRPTFWPGGDLLAPCEGPGVLRAITGTDPAAGNEFSETVPTNACWRLIGLTATLVNDATVINRFLSLAVEVGGIIHCRASFDSATTAGQTTVCSWGAGGDPAGGVVGVRSMPLQQPLVLTAGQVIRSVTGILQAGDNWSAPQFLVEEWIEG